MLAACAARSPGRRHAPAEYRPSALSPTESVPGVMVTMPASGTAPVRSRMSSGNHTKRRPQPRLRAEDAPRDLRSSPARCPAAPHQQAQPPQPAGAGAVRSGRKRSVNRAPPAPAARPAAPGRARACGSAAARSTSSDEAEQRRGQQPPHRAASRATGRAPSTALDIAVGATSCRAAASVSPAPVPQQHRQQHAAASRATTGSHCRRHRSAARRCLRGESSRTAGCRPG